MSIARSGLGVAVTDGKIYAIGGDARVGKWPFYTGSIVDINEEYDPTIDAWTTKTSMPTPRSNFAIANYQGKIYCFGGITSIDQVTWHITNKSEMYNPTTDTWENKTSMPMARRELQANVVNDKIYLIGGFIGGSDVPATTNAIYDPKTDSWSTGTPMPIVAGQFHSVVLDAKIHFVDFSEINSATPLHLVYDPIADNWSQAKAAPVESGFCTVAATVGINASKRIYIFGKATTLFDDPTAKTRIYTSATDSWEYGADMISNRVAFAVANVNDVFYVIGGYTRTLDASHFGDTITPYATNEQYIPPDYGTHDPSYSTSPPGTSETISQTANPSTDYSEQPPTWFVIGVLIAVIAVVGSATALIYSKNKVKCVRKGDMP